MHVEFGFRVVFQRWLIGLESLALGGNKGSDESPYVVGLESLSFFGCPDREAEGKKLVGLEGLTPSTGGGRISEAIILCFMPFSKHFAFTPV